MSKIVKEGMQFLTFNALKRAEVKRKENISFTISLFEYVCFNIQIQIYSFAMYFK